MSFKILKVDNLPIISKECNEFLVEMFSNVIPTEKHISELPLPKNLCIEPYFIPKFQVQFLEACIDFDVRSDDVFVCSLIRSGSSWTQTIVSLLMNNLNYQNVEFTKQMGSFEDLQKLEAAQQKIDHLLNDNDLKLDKMTVIKMAWTECFDIDSPRTIKTHLPIQFLPKAIWTMQAKVIHVVRNPKDAALSEYHYLRNFFQIDISLDDIVNGTISDSFGFSPRFPYILNYWKCKHLPNVLIIAYEDIVNDSLETIKMISKFLQCNYSDDQLKEFTEYVSFDNMKQNNDINKENAVKWMEERLNKQRPDPEFR